jgi:hypothetical protein
VKKASPDRAQPPAVGRRATGGPFALLGWVTRRLGHLPKPRNSAVALIELPYVLVKVVVFLALVIPILALSVIWLLLRMVLLLPKMVVLTVASKTSLTAGTVAGGGSVVLGDAGGDAVATGSGAPGVAAAPQAPAQRDGQLALMSGGDAAGLTVELLDRAAALWQLRERSLVATSGDMVRPVMTEGFWRVHCMLLDVRSAGAVERVFDGRVVDGQVIGATHTGIVDEVRVRLTCDGTCYDRLSDGQVLRGDVGAGRWSEEVTLRRSANLTAPARGWTPVSPTSCANCGAPLEVRPDGSCTTCHALVAAHPGDWVLDDGWRERW